MPAVVRTLAPAKVNLTLHVLGRRADGYHDLESLVAFASFGDRLTLRCGPSLGLTLRGPTARGAGPSADNLVLRAVLALAERIEGLTLGRFILTKLLPAGAGLGGGSSDAAAALRLVARVNALDLHDPRVGDAARATGADVPVCLDPRPRLMRGIGDALSEPRDLPALGLVVVYPALAVATAGVFKALGLTAGERRAAPQSEFPGTADASAAIHGTGGAAAGRTALLARLAEGRNDLEAAAIAAAPQIAEALALVTGLPGCRLARMSGSGSACFGLFDGKPAALTAARRLAQARPKWWTRAGRIGGSTLIPKTFGRDHASSQDHDPG